MKTLRHILRGGLLAAAWLACQPGWAQTPGQTPAQTPVPSAAAAKASKPVVRSSSLPARGLFEGDRLSAAARQQIDALVRDAAELDVEVAFVVPSGPWQTETGATGERSLSPARLQAVKDHLARRGVDARRIYVESRVDPKAVDARLDVELVGRASAQ